MILEPDVRDCDFPAALRLMVAVQIGIAESRNLPFVHPCPTASRAADLWRKVGHFAVAARLPERQLTRRHWTFRGTLTRVSEWGTRADSGWSTLERATQDSCPSFGRSWIGRCRPEVVIQRRLYSIKNLTLVRQAHSATIEEAIAG